MARNQLVAAIADLRTCLCDEHSNVVQVRPAAASHRPHHRCT